MDNINISQMEQQDIPAVSRMYIALYEHLNELGSALKLNTKRLEENLNMLVDSRLVKIILIRENGQPAGFVCVSIRPANKTFFAEGPQKTGFISELYVAPQCRGKSYSKMLLGAAEDFLKASDIHISQLDVLVGNAPALSLYKSCGYSAHHTTFNKPL